MGKRSRKKKDSLVDADTVIDLDAQREARRRQLREAAAESRRRRGVPDNDRSGYDYYGDPAGTRTSVLEEEKTADGEIKGEQRTGQKKKRLTPVRIAVIAAALIALIGLVCSIWKIVSLKIEEKEKRSQIEALKEEEAALEKEAGNIGTEEYIEEQARQWLKMAKSGEIIYVFDDRDEEK